MGLRRLIKKVGGYKIVYDREWEEYAVGPEGAQYNDGSMYYTTDKEDAQNQLDFLVREAAKARASG